MIVRRSAAVLAATAVIGTAFAPAALAADSSPSPSASQAIPSGLYGSTDPTYDGVWRQSLALLAQDTVGVEPAAKAVDWLTGQQCASGAFAPYRADATAKCDAKTMVDTNNTAAAVQALAALGGHDTETGKAVAWLKSVQNKDGGWGYVAGGASDANSTSVVIGALAAAGEKPADVSQGGKSPYDALVTLSIACAGEGSGGGFAFQPDKKGKLAANADATAAAVLGSLGKGFVTTAGKTTTSGYVCGATEKLTPAEAARNGASYLSNALNDTPYLKSAMPGAKDQPDYGNTADAVVALAADGWTKDTQKPLAWLEKNYGAWAAKAGPAAYAQLIFAAHATGTDPRDFGGADLVKQLGATGPATDASDHSAAASDEKKDEKKKDDHKGLGVWWIVGVGLVAGIGIGFLISGRNKKQQL
ncbi:MULTISPECIES: prenyltransferase/squalene oxidase repeat-containing protein [unclassified Streptomyces]|uniref:prenyltransferase/squalene oxidase repeat-containing protein n=1 Tax=unclassified Streptomyces TaxID=2593676 RepID=UPI002E814B85|nr:prenyltransferase/squalene oxidase repeat-containing protein [Streptomyces sp. NBC_00589]WTI39581.1 terpene cyclase/mutase family protein [Streptomyces sp. NBC_00775]WUB26740.1 terpene cyclase/mutase family protein [Streptomyces sp. NBC_00589]